MTADDFVERLAFPGAAPSRALFALMLLDRLTSLEQHSSQDLYWTIALVPALISASWMRCPNSLSLSLSLSFVF